MPQIMLTCPNCRYECPSHSFIRLADSKLKCRRCRGEFDDPDAYRPNVSYADTDSDKMVSRFPYSLSGQNAVIRVPDGYLAYVIGASEGGMLLTSGNCEIKDEPTWIQVYYICLNPRLPWGSRGLKKFGAYGTAQLSISEDFVKNSMSANPNFLFMMEGNLQDLLCKHMSAFIDKTLQTGGAGLLTQASGYFAAQGELRYGVNLTRVYPQGYRGENQNTGTITGKTEAPPPVNLAQQLLAEKPKLPVEVLTKLPNKPYDVARGHEEVFYFKEAKVERHKAGERIDPDMLTGMKRLLRFNTKEFEFPYGWGLYKLYCPLGGTFSANGTITFYIDSTIKLSTLIVAAGSYDDFHEQFFRDVLRKELAEKLKPLVDQMVNEKDFEIASVKSRLSFLSVCLTNALNGEDRPTGINAFQNNGLRVARLDILDMHFSN